MVNSLLNAQVASKYIENELGFINETINNAGTRNKERLFETEAANKSDYFLQKN